MSVSKEKAAALPSARNFGHYQEFHALLCSNVAVPRKESDEQIAVQRRNVPKKVVGSLHGVCGADFAPRPSNFALVP